MNLRLPSFAPPSMPSAIRGKPPRNSASGHANAQLTDQCTYRRLGSFQSRPSVRSQVPPRIARRCPGRLRALVRLGGHGLQSPAPAAFGFATRVAPDSAPWLRGALPVSIRLPRSPSGRSRLSPAEPWLTSVPARFHSALAPLGLDLSASSGADPFTFDSAWSRRGCRRPRSARAVSRHGCRRVRLARSLVAAGGHSRLARPAIPRWTRPGWLLSRLVSFRGRPHLFPGMAWFPSGCPGLLPGVVRSPSGWPRLLPGWPGPLGVAPPPSGTAGSPSGIASSPSGVARPVSGWPHLIIWVAPSPYRLALPDFWSRPLVFQAPFPGL